MLRKKKDFSSETQGFFKFQLSILAGPYSSKCSLFQILILQDLYSSRPLFPLSYSSRSLFSRCFPVLYILIILLDSFSSRLLFFQIPFLLDSFTSRFLCFQTLFLQIPFPPDPFIFKPLFLQTPFFQTPILSTPLKSILL